MRGQLAEKRDGGSSTARSTYIVFLVKLHGSISI